MSEKTSEENTGERVLSYEGLRDYYREFQQTEGIPVYRGYSVDDLGKLEVKPSSRMGGLGAYVNLFGEEMWADNYVREIPPGRSLKPQRHMFEELVYRFIRLYTLKSMGEIEFLPPMHNGRIIDFTVLA